MTYEEAIIQIAQLLPTLTPQFVSFVAGLVCGSALLVGLVNR